MTLRHSDNERALPIRQFGSFLPGSGIGGTGEHWGAVFPRFMPDCFELYSKTVEHYGMKKLPEDHSMQDWGVTYDQARVSRTTRVPEKRGGRFRQSRQSEWEKDRRRQYLRGLAGVTNTRCRRAPRRTSVPYFTMRQKSLGYHPYRNPAAVTSQNYTNPDGVNRPACAFCGYCERTPCMIGAKAQPSNVMLPIVQKRKSVSIRTGTTVRRILHDTTKDGGKARGVTYIDESGEEVFQPADLVILASWTLSNNHLLMLSGIGTPYDPATGKGTLGKNLTHQVSFGVTAFMEKPLNKFMGAGGAGIRMADFDADVFDHSNLPFIRGGMISAMTTGVQPISTFGIVPRSVKSNWGAEWKKASIEYYDRTGNVAFNGEQIPHKGNHIDLDPTYKNPAGDPLLRLTINWQENERKMVDFINTKLIEISHAMGAKEVHPLSKLQQLRRRALPGHAHSGRNNHGPFSRSRRCEHAPATLGDSESLCPRRVHFSQQRRRKSHTDNPRLDVSHRRSHRG